MEFESAKKTEPQFNLLILATVVSVILWIATMFLPVLGWISYPLQLFATFIHEGGHVLASVLTGNSVQSMTISPDTSGVVYTMGTGWFSQLLISSSGYLGTTLFGTAILFWMRFERSSHLALYISAGLIGVLTVLFGMLAPLWNFMATVTVGSMAFTIFSGAVITAGLFLIARFASLKWADFALAFLAVQCLLNAVFSIVTLFFVNMAGGHSDAANMASATGIPAVVWVIIWMGISLAMITLGLRIYAVAKRSKADDSLFE